MKKATFPVLGIAALALIGCMNDSSDEKTSSSSISNNSSSSSGALVSSSSNTDSIAMSSSAALSSEAMSSSAISSSSAMPVYSVIKSDLPPLQRVIGYVPLYRDPIAMVSSPNFGIVTHANISFVNPNDTTCTFSQLRNSNNWKTTIGALRAKQAGGLKLMASIGGGNVAAWMRSLVKPNLRNIYADSLVAFMEAENLDGIDVDLEGDIVADTANYNAFVRLLADKVHAKGKLTTAAVAGWQRNSYSTSALEKLDFINLMSYDYTGPWSPKTVGQHSSMAKSINDIQLFAAKAGVGANRITLGVPFYGHNFYTVEGEKGGTSFAFYDIMNEHPEAIDIDSVGVRGTDIGITYYNGRITMRDKTIKAREFGGIMIWELGQDADGDKSLLKVIADHAK